VEVLKGFHSANTDVNSSEMLYHYMLDYRISLIRLYLAFRPQAPGLKQSAGVKDPGTRLHAHKTIPCMKPPYTTHHLVETICSACDVLRAPLQGVEC
jgi:hypothetical protein